MKIPKTDQLRVRLTDKQRADLEQRLKDRSKNETLSDLVRQIIEEYLLPATHFHAPIHWALYSKMDEIGRVLDRKPEAVISEALAAIHELVTKPDHIPLILAEYRLRLEYQKGQNNE